MGLFNNKEKRLAKKQERINKKEIAQNDLDYFKKNSDLAVHDCFFDDKNKKVLIKKSIIYNRKQVVFKYKDLLGYTPIFEGGKIKKHHGIARAAVGGLLAGPIGALVGAGTGGKEYESLKRLGFMLQLSNNESIKLLMLDSETKVDSFVGKDAMDSYNQLTNKFNQILSDNTTIQNNSISPADEILKFKNLLDNGIITQEEFDKKKIELLRQ